jgi:hypothetical protein
MEGTNESDVGKASHKGDVVATVTNGEAAEASTDTTKRWWLWPVLSVAFVYGIAVIRVFLEAPALPEVEISGGQDVEGVLLTYTDGFWYLFDLAGENKGNLVAIRDDQAETVMFPPQPPRSE